VRCSQIGFWFLAFGFGECVVLVVVRVLGAWHPSRDRDGDGGGGVSREQCFDYKSCDRDTWRHSSVQEPQQQPSSQQIHQIQVQTKMFAVSEMDMDAIWSHTEPQPINISSSYRFSSWVLVPPPPSSCPSTTHPRPL